MLRHNFWVIIIGTCELLLKYYGMAQGCCEEDIMVNWMEVIIYSGWHCQRMAHQRRSTESGQEALKDDLQRGTELGRRMVSRSLEPSLSSGKCLMSHQPLTSVLSSSMFYWHLGGRVCNTEQTAADSTLDNRERIQDNQSSLTKVSMDTNKIKSWNKGNTFFQS